jgi:hypothetical protein
MKKQSSKHRLRKDPNRIAAYIVETTTDESFTVKNPAAVIKDDKLTRIAESVKPDAKRRLLLPLALAKEGVTYHIYANSIGQIVLDPQVNIPVSEAWLFEDKAALASVDRGMVESANGQLIDLGSYAKYIKDAP